MIEKLTRAQEKKMIEVRDYWINKVYYCHPTDEKAGEELIAYLYGLASLEKPQVIYFDSPLGVQLGARGLQTGAPVTDSVWDSVTASVRVSVTASVRASVRASVWDSVKDSVEASVWASLVDSVRASVRASVGDSRIGVASNLWYGEVWSQGWQAYYDFFTRQTGLVKNKEFEKYIDLVDRANLYWIVPFENMCLVSRAPVSIKRIWRNDRWIMHSEDGMAIEWRDGWGDYYLHRVRLDKELHEKIVGAKMGFKEIMGIENVEHRMLALKYMKPEKLLKGANAKLLDKSKRGNELYQIEDLFEQTAYFLKYKDPSTERVYISGVDPEVGKNGGADECMAWKHHMTPGEYAELEVEA